MSGRRGVGARGAGRWAWARGARGAGRGLGARGARPGRGLGGWAGLGQCTRCTRPIFYPF